MGETDFSSVARKNQRGGPRSLTFIGLSRFDIHRRPGEGRGPVKMANYPGSRPPPGRRGLSAKLLFLIH